ncbi:hypothetical protein K1719_039541 [Acacia pycnantha]|nr:hypothetical protein K1719_039541 [Acacia pycnantha]
MKKELEAELVNVTGTAKPTRKIRSEQDKEAEPEAVSEVVGPGPSEESGADAPQEIDEYELVDPVDILTPLRSLDFGKEWKEAVVCPTLKKLITDVNIAVVVEAIQAISNLALGLRTPFLQVLFFYCLFYLKN